MYEPRDGDVRRQRYVEIWVESDREWIKIVIDKDINRERIEVEI